MKKKMAAGLLAVVMIMTCVIGGSLAWLSAKSDTVVNTFTVGDINITLEEKENLDLKMVPGSEILKDPKITVKEGSEPCYVFLKVTEDNGLRSYISYDLNTNWKKLSEKVPGAPENIYYQENINAADAAQQLQVLAGDHVTVKDTVTKTMMSTAKENPPKLSFQAAAVQSANLELKDAWTEAKGLLA